MRKKIKHSAYRLLNKPGLRFLLTASAATYASIRVRNLCKVSYDAGPEGDDGYFVQRFPLHTLVEPRLTLWTPEEIQKHVSEIFLHRYVPKQGDIIMDVGAGTGWETLCLSRSVGMSGRVISIEAHPRVFRCLSKMCAENRLENVTALQTAVADQQGEVQLTDVPDHEGNSIVGVTSGLRVPCTTLDYIFRSLELSRVDFLKMNIEGAERLAVSGMGEVVRKTKNVFIACHDFLAEMGGQKEFRTKAGVIAFLEQNGFVVSLRESEGEFFKHYVYGVNEKLRATS